MNLLFVNYGDYSSNSLNHIAPFANWLVERGHECLVAVPGNLRSAVVLDRHLFGTATYLDVLTAPYHFRNRRSADVLYAWTPRVSTASFVSRYASRYGAPAVVTHLEDDEESLIEDFYGVPRHELRMSETPPNHKEWIRPLSHPLQYKAFLGLSDGITAIRRELLEYAPPDRPTMELPPGVDEFSSDHDSPSDIRASLGIARDETLIVYPGGVTASNIADIVELVEAVRLLRDRYCVRVKLLKTGPSSPALAERCSGPIDLFVNDLGFLPKQKVLGLLKAADVLVQPGRDNSFNRYRLPSKLPEFLLSGRPVIAPTACADTGLVDGEHALLLENSSREEIAEKIRWVMDNPKLSQKIGHNGREAARLRYDLDANATNLLEFLTRVNGSSSGGWQRSKGSRRPFKHALKNRLRNYPEPEVDRAFAPMPEELAKYARSSHLLQEDLGWTPFKLHPPLDPLRWISKFLTIGLRRAPEVQDHPYNFDPVGDCRRHPKAPYRGMQETCTSNAPSQVGATEPTTLCRPTFSMLLPVYKTEPEHLEAAIASVRAQTYPAWELCIVDDASGDPSIQSRLEKHASEEPRIKVRFRSQNGHISIASNDALSMASGEYVALLDHDDTISPSALACVADALRSHPRIQVLYTDEDKICENGYSQPHFKTDWNYDLLLGQNYIAHFCVLKTATVLQIGGFRSGHEGSQDWDLLLRIIRVCDPREVLHLPIPLYHWRESVGSTAMNSAQKPYARDAAHKALSSHLEAQEPGLSLESVNELYWRARFALPRESTSIHVFAIGLQDRISAYWFEVEICKNSPSIRLKCQPLPVCASESETFDRLNAAIEATGAETIVVLDGLLRPASNDPLAELAAQCCRSEIGIVGPKILNPDATVRHTYQILTPDGTTRRVFEGISDKDDGYFHKAHLVSNASILSLHAMAFRKSVWSELGGFDLSLADYRMVTADFCLRSIQAGYRNLYTPFSKFIYRSRPSDAQRLTSRQPTDNDLFRRFSCGDPFYNTNCSIDRADFTPARPIDEADASATPPQDQFQR